VDILVFHLKSAQKKMITSIVFNSVPTVSKDMYFSQFKMKSSFLNVYNTIGVKSRSHLTNWTELDIIGPIPNPN